MPHRRASYGQGPAHVWVEDRHGADLPYSKGLMAASIMATGLPPGRSYALAASIEDDLLASGIDLVCADELATLAAEVLTRLEGPDIADRYLAWRHAKRSPNPIVVLIGGATGVGKSTVATKLAARLALPRVIPTDTIREVMRTFLPADQVPEIHGSSFEAPILPGITYHDPVVEAFDRQSATVATGVQGVIERMVVEHKDVIVEGIHLVPGMLDPYLLHKVRREAVVVEVVLTLEDPAVHRAHFLTRMDNEHGRNPERYLRRLADIRRIQDHIRARAHSHAVPQVDAGDLDDTIQEVLNLVVAEVTASRQLDHAWAG
ncbi:MAG: hypothetical protein ACRDVM_07775 [Acidimicrobiia bacterium]